MSQVLYDIIYQKEEIWWDVFCLPQLFKILSKLNENVDIAITSTWGDIKCALKMWTAINASAISKFLQAPCSQTKCSCSRWIVHCSKWKKENKKEKGRKKQGAAGADVLLNTLTPINHWLVSPAIYQQLLPRLGREMANISGVRPNRYLPHSATLC